MDTELSVLLNVGRFNDFAARRSEEREDSDIALMRSTGVERVLMGEEEEGGGDDDEREGKRGVLWDRVEEMQMGEGRV